MPSAPYTALHPGQFPGPRGCREGGRGGQEGLAVRQPQPQLPPVRQATGQSPRIYGIRSDLEEASRGKSLLELSGSITAIVTTSVLAEQKHAKGGGQDSFCLAVKQKEK